MLDSKVFPRVKPPEMQAPARSVLANVVILCLSAGLLLWAYQLLQNKLTRVTSRDAVVNGRLVNLTAPIEGTVTDVVTSGSVVTAGQTLAAIANDKVSELQVQEIKGRIHDSEVQLQRAQNQLESLYNLKDIWAQRQVTDDSMTGLGKQREIEEAEAELKASESQLQLAMVTYERSQGLSNEGVIPRADFDRATMERDRLVNEIDSIHARIERLRTDQDASQMGLNLNRQSNSYDPRIRIQELDTQIIDKKLEIQTLEQGLVDAKAALVKAETDLKNNLGRTVKAPEAGVIWQLTAQKGQFVEKGTALGQLLDCGQRWIDVTVDESAVEHLYPGMPATIELNGKKQTLDGRVSTIRAGVGRLQVGQDVAVPVAPNLPRTAQVRVDLAQSGDRGAPEAMCYVGYTGKVTFAR